MIGIAVTLLTLLLTASTAHAHGGGLDKLGCHHNRKAGGYHCHRGAMSGQSFGSKAEALRSTQGKRERATSRRAPATGAAITGRASVIDGDTIDIHGQRIRFHGIDAPESRQTCEVMGKAWRCGQQASLALASKINRRPVTCRPRDRDRYNRVVAVCYVGSEDLNRWMVANGWAMAYRRYSAAYIGQEDGARRARQGIWRGEVVPPWEWRRGKRLQAATDRQPGNCRIKGNISRSGIRIYHVPGGQYHSRTRIDRSKGERWFCSEADARAAGWRKSQR